MMYSFLCYHSFQVLYCLYKQCMDLVGWIHWVYRRVHILDLQNVLMMDTCILRLKDNYLDCQNDQLMGL